MGEFMALSLFYLLGAAVGLFLIAVAIHLHNKLSHLMMAVFLFGGILIVSACGFVAYHAYILWHIFNLVWD